MVFPTKPQGSEVSCGFFVSGSPVSFRSMVPDDLDEVMAIASASFRHPWSSRFFLQELQAPCARSIRVRVGDTIHGYLLFWRLPAASPTITYVVPASYA